MFTAIFNKLQGISQNNSIVLRQKKQFAQLKVYIMVFVIIFQFFYFFFAILPSPIQYVPNTVILQIINSKYIYIYTLHRKMQHEYLYSISSLLANYIQCNLSRGDGLDVNENAALDFSFLSTTYLSSLLYHTHMKMIQLNHKNDENVFFKKSNIAQVVISFSTHLKSAV